ncbi:MAG TPA: hypothetical protein V6D08_01835, partial [Candidatus Obscuribacterales bacterium]
MSRTAGTSTIEQKDASSQAAFAGLRHRSWWHLCWLAAIFTVALALRLWFNFAAAHPNCAVSCDASEYLRNALALHRLAELPSGFWQLGFSCLTGQAGNEIEQQVRQRLGFLAEMHQSGPVFPLFLLVSYSLTGARVDPADWLPPVAAQCLISALTCVLIALIGSYAWDRRTGCLAGMLAAVYPAFIINSGRLYSETFSAFLLCGLAWTVLRGFSRPGNGYPMLFLTGVTAASLELTRSVMFLLCLALLPLIYMQNRDRRPLSAVAVLLLGFATVVVPWWAVEKLAFGKTSLIVDRVGHYNFSVGNNVDTQGWLSYPYPDLTGIEQKSYPALARQSLGRSPERWLKLMLDKPVRLFKLPWNDFRLNVGPFGPAMQAAFHQILLLLAAAGGAIALTTAAGNRAPDRRQRRCRLVVAGILAFHLVYLFFITVPRYNLTAMPFVLLFSAAGTVGLLTLLCRRASRPYAAAALCAGVVLFVAARAEIIPLVASLFLLSSAEICLVAAILLKTLCVVAWLLTFWRLSRFLTGDLKVARAVLLWLGAVLFLVTCLPLRAHGRWYEWRCPLEAKGERVTQRIRLPAEALPFQPDAHCYLMIDCDGACDGLAVSINGQTLATGLIPGLALQPELKPASAGADGHLRRECEYIFDCLTQAAGISNRNLRQWYLIPIPRELLPPSRKQNYLTVSVTKTAATQTTLFGTYDLADNQLHIPSATLCSWEKAFYGVENDAGLTDTRYDARILRSRYAGEQEQSKDLSPCPGRQSGAYNIRLLVARCPAEPVGSGGQTLASFAGPPIRLAATGTASRNIKLDALPCYGPSDCWLITVSGEIKSSHADTSAGIDVLAQFQPDRSRRSATYKSVWTPRTLTAAPQWQSFEFTLPLQPGYFPGTLTNLAVRLRLNPQ